jgi:hypothetical protein
MFCPFSFSPCSNLTCTICPKKINPKTFVLLFYIQYSGRNKYSARQKYSGPAYFRIQNKQNSYFYLFVQSISVGYLPYESRKNIYLYIF